MWFSFWLRPLSFAHTADTHIFHFIFDDSTELSFLPYNDYAELNFFDLFSTWTPCDDTGIPKIIHRPILTAYGTYIIRYIMADEPDCYIDDSDVDCPEYC